MSQLRCPSRSEPAVDRAPISAIPHDLLDRPIAAFVRRGATVLETGGADARVLVVVERGPGTPPDGSPLAGEAASLLQLMLRAIDLERTDVSLCLPAPDGVSGPPVRELAGGSRRTIVWLVHDVETNAVGEIAGDEKLRSLGLAAWRLPHPELLLERPLLKREAWQALKGVRRRLEELAA